MHLSFLFYFNNKLDTECVVITVFVWIYIPRCPIRNITRKFNNTNSYTEEDALIGIGANTDVSFWDWSNGYCPTDPDDPTSPLDPDDPTCLLDPDDPTSRPTWARTQNK